MNTKRTTEYTIFSDKDELRNKISNVVDKLERLMKTNSLMSIKDRNIAPVSSYQQIAKILELIELKTLKRMLGNILLQSERFSSGSAQIGMELFIKLWNSLRNSMKVSEQHPNTLLQELELEIGNLTKLLSETYKPTTQKLNDKVIYDICEEDELLSEAIRETIKVAGFEGNIRIENNNIKDYCVECKVGYVFKNLQVLKGFLDNSNNRWERNEVRVLVIDGVIETVAEIDNIIRKAFETKEPLLLIASNFSEEVIATLVLNKQKGILDVVPCKLALEIENLNVNNDIAIVSGASMVSTTKGDMICFVKYDTLPIIEKVLLQQDGTLTIHNKSTINDVAAHIKYLLERRTKAEKGFEVCYDNRIKSLLSHSVILRLPCFSETKELNIRTKLDVCLRTIKSLNSHGIFNKEKCLEEQYKPETTIGKILKQALQEIKMNNVPCLTVYSVLVFVCKFVIELWNCEGLINNIH